MKFTLRKIKNPGVPKIKKVRKISFSYKYIYIIVYLAGLGALVYISYFIFQNYYQTITQAEEIIDLRKEVAPDSIDIERVNQVLDALDAKSTTTTVIIPPNIKNPFDPVAEIIQPVATFAEIPTSTDIVIETNQPTN